MKQALLRLEILFLIILKSTASSIDVSIRDKAEEKNLMMKFFGRKTKTVEIFVFLCLHLLLGDF